MNNIEFDIKAGSKLDTKERKFIRKYLLSHSLESVSFLIKPYIDKDLNDIEQIGVNSKEFNILGEVVNSSINEELDLFVEKRLFEVVAVFRECEFDEPVKLVIGNIYGYLINLNKLLYDLNYCESLTSILFDSHSYLLSSLWCAINELNNNNFFNKLNTEEDFAFVATNVTLINEFLNPYLDDLILSRLIKSYFNRIHVNIKYILKTISFTELDDQFKLEIDDYNYEAHLNTLINELNYTNIIIDNTLSDFLLKNI